MQEKFISNFRDRLLTISDSDLTVNSILSELYKAIDLTVKDGELVVKKRDVFLSLKKDSSNVSLLWESRRI